MARNARQPPLPDVPRANVADEATQRAFTSIVTSLQAIIKFLLPFKQPTPWRYLLYDSGWQDRGSVWQRGGVRKDAMGRVHLRGLVQRASGSSVTIATLPPGHRPQAQRLFAVISAGAMARVDIEVDGDVVITGGTPADYVSLDGISFDTEA